MKQALMSEHSRNIITASAPPVLRFLNPLHLLRNLYGHRELIIQFTKREVEGRYKGTYLGLLWSLLNPLLTLAVYTFAFAVIMKARFEGSQGGRLDFALNMFCGLIVFGIFRELVSRAPRMMVESSNFVKRIVFPLEIIPPAILCSSVIFSLFSLCILLPAVLLVQHTVSQTIYQFPLILLPLCAMTLGLSWLLASLGVFLRDMGHFVGVATQLLFFGSPIIYPLSAVPERFQLIMRLNPLSTFLENSRRTLIHGEPLEWGWWLVTLIVSLVVLQIGYAWFMRSKTAFADVV